MTPREQDAFCFIKRYLAEHGISPTYREIGEAIGVSKITAFEKCQSLARQGYIRMGGSRGIKLVRDNPIEAIKAAIRRLRDCADAPTTAHIQAAVADLERAVA